MALKIMIKLLSLLLTLGLSLPLWADSGCQDLLLREALTPAQKTAILHADSGDYKVSVLWGLIDNKPKTVVLFGEAHLKDSAAKEAGREVVKHFNLRGLEGASVEITWGGRVLAWAVHAGYAFNRILTFGKRQHETTIDDAIESAKTSGARNIPLEKGHVPDLPENIQSIILPTQMLTCAAAFCGDVLYYLEPTNTVSNVTTPLVWIVAGVGLTQAYGAKLLRPHFKDEKWFKTIFAINYGLINARDKTMTNNVHKALSEHPDENAILVIVGKDHVDGMRDLLKQNFGFQDLELAKD